MHYFSLWQKKCVNVIQLECLFSVTFKALHNQKWQTIADCRSMWAGRKGINGLSLYPCWQIGLWTIISATNAQWWASTLRPTIPLLQLPTSYLQMSKAVAFRVCFLEWLWAADMHRQACLWNQKEKSFPLGSLVPLLEIPQGLPVLCPQQPHKHVCVLLTYC